MRKVSENLLENK